MLASSSGALASPDCAELSVADEFLSTFYCKELQALTQKHGTARAITAAPVPDEPWGEIKILREAYRADPSKTLDLIKRIKTAGGLKEN